MLKTIAERVRGCIPVHNIVAPTEGDEFAVLLSRLISEQDLSIKAREVLAALVEPLLLKGRPVDFRANIGACLDPDHASILGQALASKSGPKGSRLRLKPTD